MNKHNLKVGQKLFIKRERRNSEAAQEDDFYAYEVEKIGRVWAKLKHPYYRVHLETLVLDGSRHNVYLSIEQYNTAVALQAAWVDFYKAVNQFNWRRPEYVTLEGIKEARLKLGL